MPDLFEWKRLSSWTKWSEGFLETPEDASPLTIRWHGLRNLLIGWALFWLGGTSFVFLGYADFIPRNRAFGQIIGFFYIFFAIAAMGKIVSGIYQGIRGKRFVLDEPKPDFADRIRALWIAPLVLTVLALYFFVPLVLYGKWDRMQEGPREEAWRMSVIHPITLKNVAFLQQRGVEAWNRDFHNFDKGAYSKTLYRAKLANAQLMGVKLSGAFLEEADFSGGNLRNADLAFAKLRKANFTGADLSGCQLDGADLTEAVFTGANLSGASIYKENQAIFRNAGVRNFPSIKWK